MSVRQIQLQWVTYMTRLILKVRKRKKVKLHSIELKTFVHQLQLDKTALLLNPKRRKILLNPATRRRRMLICYNSTRSSFSPPPSKTILKLNHATRRRIIVCYNKTRSSFSSPPPSKTILQRRIHQYKSIDGYKYGLLLWAQKEKENGDSDKALRYDATINFMYRLRNGLFINQENWPWGTIPFPFESPCNTQNINTNNIIRSIPVGLATLIIGLGIPNMCIEKMFRDISRFAVNLHQSAGNVALCMEIRIATLNLEGEDVLATGFRAIVDQYCRMHYIDDITGEEANIQPFRLLDACNMVEEEDQDEKYCCSICLEKLRGGCSSKLPCSHVFHYDCLFKWMSKYNSCPLCRHPYQRLFHPIQTTYYQRWYGGENE